jgi:hypothetical protein
MPRAKKLRLVPQITSDAGVRAVPGVVKFLLFLFAAAALPAQTPPAEAPASATLPGDGPLVKALQILAPPEPSPLTGREQFRLYAGYVIGIYPVLGEAAGAGISQWIDSPPEWGQGSEGYFKRFGNNLAYNAIRNTITYAVSVPMKEDNRYFASGRSSVPGRVGHALLSPVVARHPNGREYFSVSGAAGIVGAATISLAWAPPSWQGAGSACESIGLTYAATAGLNLVREFVPDLIRKLRGRQ